MKKVYYSFFVYMLVLLNFLAPDALNAEEATSISDTNSFRQFCLEASVNDAVFRNFKLYPAFVEFMENVSYDLGLGYLKIIKEKYSGLLTNLDTFKTNDVLGNPMTYVYDIGRFSPTTLRYVKVAGDLLELFPQIETMKIVEIGGGYGGQCKILADVTSFQEYTIVDLPEPLALTKKYLDAFGIKNVRYLTLDQLKKEKFDLVISNYAFSQCSRSVQKNYIQTILRNTPYGYMTMDFPKTQFQEKPLSPSEVAAYLIKNPLINVRIVPENPLSGPNNVILNWRKK